MRRQFISLSPEQSLADAHAVMRLGRLRELPVARDGVLVGALSYPDLQERMGLGAAGVRVDEAMRPTPEPVSPDRSAGEAARRMLAHGLGVLPVVEPTPAGLHLVGVITERDLLRAAYEG